MTRPIVRDPIYRRRRFDAEIIELRVRLYITYRLSNRKFVAMMADVPEFEAMEPLRTTRE
jgi:transposase-like protein